MEPQEETPKKSRKPRQLKPVTTQVARIQRIAKASVAAARVFSDMAPDEIDEVMAVIRPPDPVKLPNPNA